MVIALLRLVMRPSLDKDPLIEAIRDEGAAGRKATSAAGRSAARRARGTAAETADASGAHDA